MKPILASLILVVACAPGLRAADTPTDNTAADLVKDKAVTPADLLAEQVKQIAATPDMAEKTKAKLISIAVQQAVTQAVAGVDDPAEALNLADELAGAAAKAAPQFSSAITQAVMANPAIARIDGALASVQASVQTGARDAGLAGRPAGARVNAQSDFGGSIGDRVVSPSF